MNEFGPDEFESLDRKASRTAYLIARYLRQKLSDIEKAELDNWISESTVNQKFFEEITDPRNIQRYTGIIGKRDKERIRRKIDEGIPPAGISRIPVRGWVIAAVMIGLIVTLFFAFVKRGTGNAVPGAVVAFQIKAGADKAILTLGSGATIILDSIKKGVIGSERGVLLKNSGNGELQYIPDTAGLQQMETFNTVSTPKGGQYKIIMSDGTHVWLNAGSSISYPVVFNDSVRKVKITGEVYLEVAKDKSKRFLAEVREATVEVLGTHFNINSYDDEPELKVSLLEGSIEMRAGAQTKRIKPGEQIILGRYGTLKVGQADMEQVTAWKNGYFRWNNENIVSIMRQVSRWYDVDVVYTGDIRNENFGGIVARKDSIGKVLRIMESTATVHFKTEGKKITVMR